MVESETSQSPDPHEIGRDTGDAAHEAHEAASAPQPPDRLRAVALDLADYALSMVRDEETGRVRVEDYLTLLAAASGEAVLVASGIVDVESNSMNPGGAILGAAINNVLSGDKASFSGLPADSALGILVQRLVPDVFPLELFGSMDDLFKHVVSHFGHAPWGEVATSVPEQNKPTVLPLKAAFDLRDAVTAVQEELGLPVAQRHIPCVHALALALEQTKPAIDPGVAITLSLEVLFTMSKMVPVPKSALDGADDDEK